MSNDVRAEIKGIHIWVAAFRRDTIETYEPDDPTVFGFNAQIFIGSIGEDFFDSFDICVCSPAWFAQMVEEGNWDRFRNGILDAIPDSVATGSYLWFMRSWDREKFMGAVQVICDAYGPAKDWGTLASRIGRVIPWEYAYRYDVFVDEHFGEAFPPPRPT